MKLLFILDPLKSLKTYKDTSVAIMRAAAARGHDLFVCEQHDVFLRNDQVKFIARKLELLDDKTWYKLNLAEELISKDFDAILMLSLIHI